MKLKNLETQFLGKNNFYYEKIDSTQSEIWRRIENNNIKDGTLIFADIQTSGKGTHGRIWQTDEKNNIAFSIYIEMNSCSESLNGLTIEIAEIIKEFLENKYGVEIQIKEPNDLYIKDKKVGGILTEAKIFAQKVKYLVIGIGINTNKEQFAESIKEIATSIKKEFKITIDAKEFITEFCNRFEKQIIKRRKI